jgi:ATP-dependent Clp protease protease subunit
MSNNRYDLDIDWEDDEVKNLSKTTLPDPILLDYYNHLAAREIFINDYIDEELIEYSYQIIKWNKYDKNKKVEEKVPIKIFINTNGGCLNSTLNFINTIKLSKTPVWTIAMGKAYSAGGLLLMAGSRRLIFPDTTVLIHDGSTGAFGDTGKVIDNLEFTQKQEERVKKYILANTKITPKLYEKNYRRDWWLFAEECIELSIADSIITNIDEII